MQFLCDVRMIYLEWNSLIVNTWLYYRLGMHFVFATRVLYSRTFMVCTRAHVCAQNAKQSRLHSVSNERRSVRLGSFTTKVLIIITMIIITDTFNHITLEIPRVSKLDFGIVLMRDPHGNEEPALPIKYSVSVPQTGTVNDLIAALSNISGVPASMLNIYNVVIDKCYIAQLYRYVFDSLSLGEFLLSH